MLSSLTNAIRRNLRNYSGWTTQRKIVVLESDDWGSIRMPSRKVYREFLDKGIPLDKSPYCRYDTLARPEDLEALFNTLDRFKDSHNNPPVITANALMANPDFDKIEASGFTEYHFERFTDTLIRYYGCESSFELWKEGEKSGLFCPQFHGREHINVPFWLNLLRKDHRLLKLAFNHRFWGLSSGILKELDGSIQATYDGTSIDDLKFHRESIRVGLDLFEDIFGYRSKSFIASNYIWNSDLEKTLSASGVRFIQGMKYQLLPKNKNGKENRYKIRHYIGERNTFGQVYLLRNCVFEPSLHDENFDNVGECLKDISNAFFWNKPAIITSHRLNFIGHLELDNRSRNLEALSRLLNEIIELWPQVEFMTSVQLGNQIKNELAQSS